MEADGLLKQQHISGGRIPTDQAFRKYVEACRDQGVVEKVQEEAIQRIVEGETREVATFLNRCADTLSELTKCAVYLDKEVDALFLRSAEEYFLWRMNKGEKPLFKDEMEAKLSQKIYNEVMVRHVVGYANFPEEDIIRTGLAKLLAYPEFNDASALANSLSLLEDVNQMRELLRKCAKKNQMISWIGNELCPVVPEDARNHLV